MRNSAKKFNKWQRSGSSQDEIQDRAGTDAPVALKNACVLLT